MSDPLNTVLGQLLSIAESWPLQLTVRAADGSTWAATLGDAAQVTMRGTPASPAVLRPGQQLELHGRLVALQAMAVAHINVL